MQLHIIFYNLVLMLGQITKKTLVADRIRKLFRIFFLRFFNSNVKPHVFKWNRVLKYDSENDKNFVFIYLSTFKRFTKKF